MTSNDFLAGLFLMNGVFYASLAARIDGAPWWVVSLLLVLASLLGGFGLYKHAEG